MTDKVVFEDYFGFPEKNYFRSTCWWVNFIKYIEERRTDRRLIETNRTFLKDVNGELLKYQAACQIDYASSAIVLTFNSPEDYFAFVMEWA